LKIELKNQVLAVDNMDNEKEFIINDDGEVVKNKNFDPDASDEDDVDDDDDNFLEIKPS